MKTLKQTVIALGLILIYGTTSAFAKGAQSMPIAVNTYIDAVVYGKTDKLEELIDNRAVFTIASGTSVKSYDKKSVLGMIKANQSVQQNCETSFKVIESDDKRASVKIMYKYENFIRVDNITMSGTKNGWKITKVASSYV